MYMCMAFGMLAHHHCRHAKHVFHEKFLNENRIYIKVNGLGGHIEKYTFVIECDKTYYSAIGKEPHNISVMYEYYMNRLWHPSVCGAGVDEYSFADNSNVPSQ